MTPNELDQLKQALDEAIVTLYDALEDYRERNDPMSAEVEKDIEELEYWSFKLDLETI